MEGRSFAALSSQFGWGVMGAEISKLHSRLLGKGSLLEAVQLSQAILDTPTGLTSLAASAE